jgi:hypothetical protein
MRYAVSIAVVLALLAAFAGLGFLLVLVIGVSAFVGGAVAVAAWALASADQIDQRIDRSLALRRGSLTE